LSVICWVRRSRPERSLPVLSREFAAELVPEHSTRLCVLLAAALASFTGAAFILTIPVAIGLRAALLAVWIGYCRRDIRCQLRGYARISRLRLDTAGGIRAIGPLGQAELLQLGSGSVVLSRAAWLRMKFADGSVYGELLLGHPLECEHWHRLQLIWQQRSGAFGQAR
jgi:hypothetical protein